MSIFQVVMFVISVGAATGGLLPLAKDTNLDSPTGTALAETTVAEIPSESQVEDQVTTTPAESFDPILSINPGMESVRKLRGNNKKEDKPKNGTKSAQVTSTTARPKTSKPTPKSKLLTTTSKPKADKLQKTTPHPNKTSTTARPTNATKAKKGSPAKKGNDKKKLHNTTTTPTPSKTTQKPKTTKRPNVPHSITTPHGNGSHSTPKPKSKAVISGRTMALPLTTAKPHLTTKSTIKPTSQHPTKKAAGIKKPKKITVEAVQLTDKNIQLNVTLDD